MCCWWWLRRHRRLQGSGCLLRPGLLVPGELLPRGELGVYLIPGDRPEELDRIVESRQVFLDAVVSETSLGPWRYLLSAREVALPGV